VSVRGHLHGRPWRGTLTDEEFLWVRLFAMLDEVQSVIGRLERERDDDRASTLALLERLRADLVAALRLATAEPGSQG
jgi:hypothetical protein